jgi:hypothetical protein
LNDLLAKVAARSFFAIDGLRKSEFLAVIAASVRDSTFD